MGRLCIEGIEVGEGEFKAPACNPYVEADEDKRVSN